MHTVDPHAGPTRVGEHGKEGEVVHGEKKEDPLKDVARLTSAHTKNPRSGRERFFAFSLFLLYVLNHEQRT